MRSSAALPAAMVWASEVVISPGVVSKVGRLRTELNRAARCCKSAKASAADPADGSQVNAPTATSVKSLNFMAKT